MPLYRHRPIVRTTSTMSNCSSSEAIKIAYFNKRRCQRKYAAISLTTESFVLCQQFSGSLFRPLKIPTIAVGFRQSCLVFDDSV